MDGETCTYVEVPSTGDRLITIMILFVTFYYVDSGFVKYFMRSETQIDSKAFGTFFKI